MSNIKETQKLSKKKGLREENYKKGAGRKGKDKVQGLG